MQENIKFIEIAEDVFRLIERDKKYILEQFEFGVPNKQGFFEHEMNSLKSGRYDNKPAVNVLIEGISMFGYYKLGWDAAENGTQYEVPETLYMWDKEVLSEIEKKGLKKHSGIIEKIAAEAISQYVNGAADAWVYHWLKSGQADKETEADSKEHESNEQKKPVLQWNGNMNILATIFYDLIECGAITCTNRKGNGGVNAEVSRMITNYFIGEDGKPMDEGSVYNVLKKSRGKSRFRIAKDNLKPYIKKRAG